MSEQNQDEMFSLVVLDINMPIMDGFEACKAIRNFFDRSKLFNINNDNDLIISRKMSNSRKMSINVDINQRTCPIIISCTGNIVTPEVLKDAKAKGFDHMFEVPLTSSNIKDHIMPLLKEKRRNPLVSKSISNFFK